MLVVLFLFVAAVSCGSSCLPVQTFPTIGTGPANPSFEVGSTGCTVDGWSVADTVMGAPQCVVNWQTDLSSTYPTTHGSKAFYFSGYRDTAPLQVLNTTINNLIAGKKYRLSFDMAPANCSACLGQNVAINDAHVTIGFTNTDLTPQTFTVSTVLIPSGGSTYRPFVRQSKIFTANAATVQISLSTQAPASWDFGVDNFFVEPICVGSINQEVTVSALSPTPVGTNGGDPVIVLPVNEAVRVTASLGSTWTDNNGTTWSTVDGRSATCAAPGPVLAGANLAEMLFTLNDTNFKALPLTRPFTVVGPGTLKFIMNDCAANRTDNFGVATAIVKSVPTISCENVLGGCPLATTVAAATANTSVVAFDAGESLNITASGVWAVHPTLLGAFDADGSSGVPLCPPTNPGFKFGALIGSFDNFATSFLIGKGPTTVKNFDNCQRTLQVRSNDCDQTDNFGSLNLTYCSRAATFSTDLGVCTRTVPFAAPVVSNKCVNATITPTSPFVNLAVGSNTRQFTAVDENLEAAMCRVTMTIVDNEPPLFTSCPANIVKNVTTGCSIPITYTVTAEDNCPNQHTLVTPTLLTPGTTDSGQSFTVGTTTVTWQAAAGGLKTNCTFTVKVQDFLLPTLTCAAPITTCAGSVISLSSLAATATDNCGTPTVQVLSPAGFTGLVPSGTTTVTIRAVDASGNVSPSCSTTLIGVAENQACAAGKKCVSTACVPNCIAGVTLSACTGADNFAYQYGISPNATACTKIIRDPADFRNVIIGAWTTNPTDGLTQTSLNQFVGTFKMTTSGFPVALRSFAQVTGTKSFELKTPPSATCSLKFNNVDRKRVTPLVLGGGASPFPV